MREAVTVSPLLAWTCSWMVNLLHNACKHRSGDTRGRGQRSFGVTCLGMKSAGTKASFRTKVRAPWGSEVSEFGVVGVVWSSRWQKVPGCLRRREFKEEGDCKVQGRQLEAWTSPLATERSCQSAMC